MKNFAKIIFASAVAALALASCQKQENSLDQNVKTVNFKAQEVATKTTFGKQDGTSYPVLWTANEEVAVSLNYGQKKRASVRPSKDFKTSGFTLSVADDGTGAYTFTSISPDAAAVSVSPKSTSWTVRIPASQTANAASVDEKAQVLFGKTETLSTFPSNVTMTYSHLTAYGKMAINNLPADAELQSVDLIAAKNWVGDYFYYVETNGTNAAGSMVEKPSATSNAINVVTSSKEAVWFACAPVDLGGTALTVKAKTSKGVYEKTVTIPAGKQFVAGKVASFSIDMTGVSPAEDVVYTLVKSLADLTVNSEIIIANASGDKAMGTQKPSNRTAESVTLTGETIVNPAEAVTRLVVENGTEPNTFAFKDGEAGYIYAAGGTKKNSLKVSPTLTKKASWTVSIASDGVATLKSADKAVTKNWLRYNDGSNLFSCYSTQQTDIKIYKRN